MSQDGRFGTGHGADGIVFDELMDLIGAAVEQAAAQVEQLPAPAVLLIGHAVDVLARTDAAGRVARHRCTQIRFAGRFQWRRTEQEALHLSAPLLPLLRPIATAASPPRHRRRRSPTVKQLEFALLLEQSHRRMITLLLLLLRIV